MPRAEFTETQTRAVQMEDPAESASLLPSEPQWRAGPLESMGNGVVTGVPVEDQSLSESFPEQERGRDLQKPGLTAQSSCVCNCTLSWTQHTPSCLTRLIKQNKKQVG